MKFRIKKGWWVEDHRKEFSVTLPDGRKAMTKANTLEEAIKTIEDTLEVSLQEAA